MKKILILGGDGYLGWPTAMHLSNKGHEVMIVDNLSKRTWEAEMGVEPLVRLSTLQTRVKRWHELTGKKIDLRVSDIATNHRAVYTILEEYLPDAIVHYAEQPSAPYSMTNREKCVYTQQNNVVGTLNLLFAIRHACPDAHIVKLGTMGEYGTPNIDIEEGWLNITHNGRDERVLFPKRPGSFYHLSKVHDSNNLEFACRIWGTRVTDLNQGIVYGIDTDETSLDEDLITSFHYDAVFGTVLNRFVVQAVCGIPLTVYGKGGQTRGFLNIRDTLKCVELAIMNPAEQGEFRVFNQFTEQFSIMQLAEKVKEVGDEMGLNVAIDHIDNPRVELETHYFNAKHSALEDLGLVPELLTPSVIRHMIEVAQQHKSNVHHDIIKPDIPWKAS